MQRIQHDSPPALLRPLLLHLAPTAPTIFPVSGIRRAPHPTILGANESHIPPSPHKLPGGRQQDILHAEQSSFADINYSTVVVSSSSHSWSLSKTPQRHRHAASEKYQQQASSSSNLGIS